MDQKFRHVMDYKLPSTLYLFRRKKKKIGDHTRRTLRIFIFLRYDVANYILALGIKQKQQLINVSLFVFVVIYLLVS